MGNKFSKHTDDYTSFLFHLQIRGSAAESSLDNFVLFYNMSLFFKKRFRQCSFLIITVVISDLFLITLHVYIVYFKKYVVNIKFGRYRIHNKVPNPSTTKQTSVISTQFAEQNKPNTSNCPWASG